MQPPHDDDGVTHLQRLDPQKIDVVLGSPINRRTVTRPPRSKAPWIAVLAVLGLAVYMSVFRTPLAVTPPAAVPEAVDVASQDGQAPDEAPAIASAPSPTLAPVVTLPRQQPEPIADKPQPLDNCLKNGSTLDEDVARCRFGAMPRPGAASPPAQGMVSASYMAQYKAQQGRPVSHPGKPYQIATVDIREYKGRDRYRAQWKIVDNEIDNDTVCGNFPADSVERRECRRGAEVYFKESCQEWTRRADRECDAQTQAAQQRYCLANKTFSAD